jgi:4-amino-4-deoxy-L-arabinose transferase-like glycosyltransferase
MRSVWVVVVVAAIALFAGLDRAAIGDSDEAYYAEAVREMLESGDLLTPRYNYANRFQKPILYYWAAAAAAFTVGGIGEASARLPAALSGFGLAILAWLVGRRWYNESTGVLAGLILSTCLGCAAIARLALPDLPLAFFITLSVVAGCMAVLEEAPRPALLILAGAASGAAFLTKGPIGLALPALVIVSLVVIERRWRHLRPGHVVVAGVVWAFIACPWYIEMARVHGPAYLQGFFVQDNLERFATNRFNYPRPFWFYLPIVLGGLLPWSVFLPLWIPGAIRWARRRERASRMTIRLVVWTLLPLALFTASVGKQPRYILPLLPPLAIALGATIQARISRSSSGRDRFLTSCGVGGGIAIATMGGLLLAVPAESLGTAAASFAWAGWAIAGAGAAVIVSATVAWRRIPAAMAGAALVLIVSLQYGVLSLPGPEAVQLVATRLRPHLAPGVRWTTHGVFARNLVFYVGQRQSGPFDDHDLVQFLNDGPAVAVMSEADFRRLTPLVTAPLHEIGRWQYFNVSGIRVGVVLEQNPERELRTIVLVSNRAVPGLAP